MMITMNIILNFIYTEKETPRSRGQSYGALFAIDFSSTKSETVHSLFSLFPCYWKSLLSERKGPPFLSCKEPSHLTWLAVNSSSCVFRHKFLHSHLSFGLIKSSSSMYFNALISSFLSIRPSGEASF